MKSYKQLLEARKSTIVFGFGRLNPPTKGHEVLANAIKTLATKHNAEHVLYVSRSQDSKKNPLNLEQKVYYVRNSFKGLNVVGASDKVRTFIEAAKELTGKYDNLIMVAGSDRVLEYKTLLDKYNGKDFNFKSILVVSAGERDPDAEGASGMSATKMRQAATDNDFSKFKSGVPSGMSASVAKKMFDDVRTGMKLSEDFDEVRDDYINEKVFNVGDIVEYKEQELAIVFRGSNYVVLEDKQKVWLHDIKPTNKVNEAIMVKQQDKLKAARIIGMALGYADAETKNDPAAIVNMALRSIRHKTLNAESKSIISRMMQLAKQMEINYDEKLLPLKHEVQEAVSDDKEERKLPEPIDAQDKVDTVIEPDGHVLMAGKGDTHQYQRIRRIQYRVHEEQEEDDMLEDEDINDIFNEINDDAIIEHGYEDDEFNIVDDETGEIIEEVSIDEGEINEVLSRIERLRSKVRMRRTQAKRERAAKIALKRRSSAPVLATRARRVAVKTLEKRLARKPLNQLSVSEKERLEARIARMKPIITKLAARLLPKVRQIERTRLEHSSTAKE